MIPYQNNKKLITRQATTVSCEFNCCGMFYLPFLVLTSVTNLSVSGMACDKLKDALTLMEELPAKRIRKKTNVTG